MSPVYCALLHYPIRSREGQPTTSAVTNLDIHDISRIARTFGLKGYFVISPIPAQLALTERILEHWRNGAGKKRMPERTEALQLCRPVSTLERAIQLIQAQENALPRVVATAARSKPEDTRLTTFQSEAERLRSSTAPLLLLFGTGHGLDQSVIQSADALLEPIRGIGDYNHLSVRAAAAIVIDRLFSAASVWEELEEGAKHNLDEATHPC